MTPCSDPQMTALMGTYLDARRKLSKKTKNRCFWPIRPKGAGKKGKTKMPFARSRKPLAVRIAESECRYCGARGHWKAECPKRLSSQSASGPPKPQPTNVPISASADVNDEEDVFLMEPMEPVMSGVFVVSQDPGEVTMDSHSNDCFVCWSHNHTERHKGQFYHQVCQRLQSVLKGSMNGYYSRMMPSEPCEPCKTPPCSEEREHLQESACYAGIAKCRPVSEA